MERTMSHKVECGPGHRYTVNGTSRPGTNEVLDLYLPPSRFFTEQDRELGLARHQWYSFLSKGLEPKTDPDHRIAKEVASFRKWLADFNPERVGGETPLYDSVLRVCGCPDWWGYVNGNLAVVDFKPWSKAKRTPLQTAAYMHNLIANGFLATCRYELRLSKEGYRFEPHEDPEDEERWEVMVYGYHAAGFYR